LDIDSQDTRLGKSSHLLHYMSIMSMYMWGYLPQTCCCFFLMVHPSENNSVGKLRQFLWLTSKIWIILYQGLVWMGILLL